MSYPYENYQNNIREIERFLEYIYHLESGLKLKEFISDFDEIFQYWSENWSDIKKESEQASDFNKKFNSFHHEKIKKLKHYFISNTEGCYDHKEIIGRQTFIMIVSVLEVFLDQQFRLLLRKMPEVYFESIGEEKNDILKNIDLNILNECKFDPGKIGAKLIEKNKLRYSFQNNSSIMEQFGRFGIKLSAANGLDIYFDVRHVLVHKLGKFDKKFSDKYGYDFGNVPFAIADDFIKSAIHDINLVVTSIEKQSNKKLGIK